MDQMYQAERPKSAAEVRRADEESGRLAKSVSFLWHPSGGDVSSMLAVHGGAAAAAALQGRAARHGRHRNNRRNDERNRASRRIRRLRLRARQGR
jgi:hypothetical protein